jgi:hypothetical protein
MTEDATGKAREYLDRYVERAENTWADEGLTGEDALHFERSGKFVEILFCTGGPHFDVLLEFADDEAGEYWFENEPVGGIAHYANWFVGDYCGIRPEEAWLLQSAMLREHDDLVERLEKVTMTVLARAGGVAQVEVDLGNETFLNNVDDIEPDDVWGPVLQRALDEAIHDRNQTGHGLHTMPDFTVIGWSDDQQDEDDDFVAVFEVSVTEYVENE